MNRIYKDEQSTQPMTEQELKREVGHWFTMDRIEGSHCNCLPNTGDFTLLPADDELVLEGGKRYMVCRNCGGYSHL